MQDDIIVNLAATLAKRSVVGSASETPLEKGA